MINLSQKISNTIFKNPIIPASGTFGYGEEISEFYDLSILGSISIKGTTLNRKYGNKGTRVAEVYGGMLNAIGLQNPGVDEVVEKKLPFLEKFELPIIANVGGSSVEEYLNVVEKISISKNVSIIELNVSCPNVKEGGISFGSDIDLLKELISKCKKITHLPIYVKLTPNVTDIVSIAKACEEAGADGLCMINTLLGMKLDLKTGKPVIQNKTGGFSGPAIKPVAIRMIYQVYKEVSIPIIGMGGIKDAYDVLEFLYAGASLVQIGTMNLINPKICKEIIEDLPRVLKEFGFKNIKEAIGFAHKEDL